MILFLFATSQITDSNDDPKAVLNIIVISNSHTVDISITSSSDHIGEKHVGFRVMFCPDRVNTDSSLR